MSVEELKKASQYLKKHNPDHVPVIIHMTKRDLKYIVDKQITMGFLLFKARKACDISKSCGLVSLIQGANVMVPISSKVNELYEKYQNREDEILHIIMTEQNAFG